MPEGCTISSALVCTHLILKYLCGSDLEVQYQVTSVYYALTLPKLCKSLFHWKRKIVKEESGCALVDGDELL